MFFNGIARMQPRQDSINRTNSRMISWNATTDQRQIDDAAYLLQVYAFSGSIRSRDDVHARIIFSAAERRIRDKRIRTNFLQRMPK